MTMTQIILSLGFTAYIFIGLHFEERDLIAEHGDSYRQYRNEAGKILPKFGK
jgi:protein-S-isoprenylcysteine O-methyltransferase Ste14